jgi:hypothetical protein
VLQNLVNPLGIPNSLNFAVMGAVILFGALADQLFKNRSAKKTARAGVSWCLGVRRGSGCATNFFSRSQRRKTVGIFCE